MSIFVRKPLRKLEYAIGAMTIMFIVACTVDTLEAPVTNEEADVSENPDYEIIRALGLRTEGIVEIEDYYIAEGDIVVSKEYVEELRRTSKTRQAYYDSPIPMDVVGNIAVYIEPELNDGSSDSWYYATIAALNEWNAIANCAIEFTVVTFPYPRNVIVRRNPEVDFDGDDSNTLPDANYCITVVNPDNS